MNLLRDFFEGIASGFVAGINPARVAVETYCQTLRWSIDERPSANELVLYFNDPLVGRRKLHISFGDQGICVGITVCSAVWMPAREVPVSVLGYLLERNGEPFVGWRTVFGDGNKVGFTLSYLAITAGLSPEILKLVCETLVKEAYEFDARMDKVGLLR